MNSRENIAERMTSVDRLKQAFSAYATAKPFHHCVVEDFFDAGLASALSEEFPNFGDSAWHEYNNAIEIKKYQTTGTSFHP